MNRSMNNRFLQLLSEYRRRPEEQEEQSLLEFVAEKDPHVFSHHPSRPEFREHVWKAGGLYWCKGCAMTFFGIVAGLLFFAATRWLYWFSDFQSGLIFFGLLFPTLLVYFWKPPRWLRHISRFLLGFLLASAFIMLFVTDSWLVRLTIVVVYFGSRIPMERKRMREHGV